MNGISRGISTNLAQELQCKEKDVNGDGLLTQLIRRLADEIVEQLRSGEDNGLSRDLSPLRNIFIHSKERTPEEALREAEDTLSKFKKEDDRDVKHTEMDDLDDVDIATLEKLEEKGYKIIYPNLKYRKPKYQNVSEVLKYVESDSGKGEGVKLVIMNFND
jgi:hypothetical protein